MQPERPVVPEFDRGRLQPHAGPVVGTGNIADAEPGGVFGDFLLQRETAFQGPGLFRGPGADPAAARTRAIILVRLLLGDLDDVAADAHLTAQGFPVEAHGGLAGPEKLLALGALEIRVEHETALVEIFQQHHAHIGQAVRIDGGKRQRVRIVRFAPFCFGEPLRKQAERVDRRLEITVC